jgi:GxxExxY protein
MPCNKGLLVETQKFIPISYNGQVLEQGFRSDLLVEGRLLIEIKLTEKYTAAHAKQVLTYLRLLNCFLIQVKNDIKY